MKKFNNYLCKIKSKAIRLCSDDIFGFIIDLEYHLKKLKILRSIKIKRDSQCELVIKVSMKYKKSEITPIALKNLIKELWINELCYPGSQSYRAKVNADKVIFDFATTSSKAYKGYYITGQILAFPF